MKTADPVVISTGLLRFLSPRDTVQMPVTLTNTTKQAQRVTVNLSKSGPFAFAGSTSKEVSLPANGEGRILVPLYASASVGAEASPLRVSMQGRNLHRRNGYHGSSAGYVRATKRFGREENTGAVFAVQRFRAGFCWRLHFGWGRN